MIFSKTLDQWQAVARKYVLAVISLVACVTPLFAQQDAPLTRHKVEAKVIFGGVTFGEDLDHKVVGGAVRVHVAKRLSIEPEYLYMWRGDNDRDHFFQPNVVVDFNDPTQRLVFYGIGGVGVLHHEGRFFGRDTSVTTWSASAGGGLKIFLTKRLFVSPEFRLGSEPTLRGTINVGYAFGGRR